MLVCSRCAGIYAGAALGVFWWGKIPQTIGKWLVISTSGLMVTQVLLQTYWLGIRHPQRLLTGVLLGLVAGALLGSALSRKDESREDP